MGNQSRADALEGWREPGHSWQCSLDGNDCDDWHPPIHLLLLAKTGFPSLPSAHLGEMLNACCESGHHRAPQGTTGHTAKGAEHGDPGAHVSLFRRLVVPGTRSSTYATAEHLRIQYTGMSADSCHYFIHMRSILHVRQRSSIDEALLSEVPQPASCIIVLRTRSLTHDSLPESARREKLITCPPKAQS